MNKNNIPTTLREKVGQLFFPAAFINDTDENIQEIENLITNYHIGGLTFFHSRISAATNFEGKKNIIRNDNSAFKLQELITHYQSLAKFRLLISIDAEWGLAMRVEKTPQYPYAITLGALANQDNNLIFEVAKNIGIDLKKIGIDYNLAPVIDINDNPKNPVIGYRSFSNNRNTVSQKAQSFCDGLRFSGVLSCLKHFPGHGNTAVDSHLGLPIINKTLAELEEQELFPFKEAIQKNEVDSIMIGHLAVPALTNGNIISATLSAEIIKNVLRKQLKYNGLIISDALNMHSVSKLYPEKGLLEWNVFDAGNDVLCFSENVQVGIEKILENASKSRINESFERLQKLKNKISLFNKNNDTTTEKLNFDFEIAANLNQQIANKVITISKNEHNLLPLKKNSKNCILNIYNTNSSVFCTELNAMIKSDCIQITNGYDFDAATILDKLTNYDTIIVALFVPSVKPLDNFEINKKTTSLLAILVKNPKVILCFFGNPYALSIIPNSNKLKTLIHCYQHFNSFQLATAQILVRN